MEKENVENEETEEVQDVVAETERTNLSSVLRIFLTTVSLPQPEGPNRTKNSWS